MDLVDGLIAGSDIWDSPMPKIHTTKACLLYTSNPILYEKGFGYVFCLSEVLRREYAEQ